MQVEFLHNYFADLVDAAIIRAVWFYWMPVWLGLKTIPGIILTCILNILNLYHMQIGALAAVAGSFILALSASIALRNWHTTVSGARERATFDLIEKKESASHYQTLHKTFTYYRRNESFSELIDPKDDEHRMHRRDVHQFINHYELVALGIKKQYLDGQTYKDWMGTVFLRDWNAVADFIQRERWRFDAGKGEWEYQTQIYVNYEELAYKWGKIEKAQMVRIGPDYSDHPPIPEGLGDEALPHNPRRGFLRAIA